MEKKNRVVSKRLQKQLFVFGQFSEIRNEPYLLVDKSEQEVRRGIKRVRERDHRLRRRGAHTAFPLRNRRLRDADSPRKLRLRQAVRFAQRHNPIADGIRNIHAAIISPVNGLRQIILA